MEILKEGKVYEVLLTTKSNITPVGITRKGNRLNFRLFEGKSANDIKEHPYGVLHITWDVELLVKAALNLPVEVEFENAKSIPIKKIKGLPSIEGRIEFVEREIEDELGKARVLECSLVPTYEDIHPLFFPPLSRADFYLLEMGIHLTRLYVATRSLNVKEAQKLYSKIWEGYRLYKKLGGESELAEKIMGFAVAALRWNP
ncbi:hypothetical protein OCC_09531 [Thermococcus litoralis DSM 5473]|uniref:DUF447 family protein n=1 Tax=Thermococcus litoralis (strain ATCC 51850 / DSM 5473 / JCM 8560 / NS-C) TaxID=523849 RepID=H3ZQT1_THELN|nr:DUF447 domain-containing protein [Thermococcus litoralis]EHR77657.1 hypothetical protein OCC_09531 [Thermococcus litoralis DSM 5473]